MYGVEAQSPGSGGLAAQAPAGDLYFGQALGINSQDSGIIGAPPTTGVALSNQAQNAVGSVTGFASASGASISPSGQAVQTPIGQQMSSWSSVLDFHNSVAPWILLAILVLYGWLHASARARVSAGRAGASAGVVL